MITQKPLVLLALMLLTLQSSLANLSDNEANAKAIQFKKGQITTSVEDVISAKQTDNWYQFNANEGQYAVINISSKSRINEVANVGVLKFPSGAQEGTKGGIIYQGCLPESGKYQLRIARNLMATHGGKAGYRAEIIILPRYASRELCD